VYNGLSEAPTSRMIILSPVLTKELIVFCLVQFFFQSRYNINLPTPLADGAHRSYFRIYVRQTGIPPPKISKQAFRAKKVCSTNWY
jgi:hypothetical protein